MQELGSEHQQYPQKPLNVLHIFRVKGGLSADNGLGLAETCMEVSYLELINLRNYLSTQMHNFVKVGLI